MAVRHPSAESEQDFNAADIENDEQRTSSIADNLLSTTVSVFAVHAPTSSHWTLTIEQSTTAGDVCRTLARITGLQEILEFRLFISHVPPTTFNELDSPKRCIADQENLWERVTQDTRYGENQPDQHLYCDTISLEPEEHRNYPPRAWLAYLGVDQLVTKTTLRQRGPVRSPTTRARRNTQINFSNLDTIGHKQIPTPPEDPPSTLPYSHPTKLDGFLLKRGQKGVVKSWKRRYFCAYGARLYYFHPQRMQYRKQSINYILIDEKTTAEPTNELLPSARYVNKTFRLKTSYTTRLYYLAADSEDDMHRWLVGINRIQRTAALLYTQPAAVDVFGFFERADPSSEPVLDVVVVEAALVEPRAGVACELRLGSAIFRTWHAPDKDINPQWNAACSFSAGDLELADTMLVALVSPSRKPMAVCQVPLAGRRTGRVYEEWRPLVWKGTVRGRVRLKLQRTTSGAAAALLADFGEPSRTLPVRLDTGDVLLFNSPHLAALGTRVFTRSQWDHVAMVIRGVAMVSRMSISPAANELYLLEATGDGVGIWPLDSRLALQLETATIAVRRLRAARTPERLAALVRFIDEVQGRPFKKDLLELVRAAQRANSPEQLDLSSLFCSELVAAAYQRMGLLSQHVTASNYIPKNWASPDNEGLELAEGVSLEKMLIWRPRDAKKLRKQREKLVRSIDRQITEARKKEERKQSTKDTNEINAIL